MPPNRLKPLVLPEGIQLLSRLFLVQYQRRVAMLFGGEPGLAEPALLDAMLVEAVQHARDERGGDLFLLTAIYVVGLARRPFRSGNIRLATVAMFTSLRLNGMSLEVPQIELAEKMMEVASGELKKEGLAQWLKKNCRPGPLDGE